MALWQQGSVFFLDCGRGPFAVTAGHVFEQFVEDRARRRVRGCQIGNIGFNPEERLIALGEDLGLDIATFHVTPEEIAATGKKITVLGTFDGCSHRRRRSARPCSSAASPARSATALRRMSSPSAFTAP